jgi:hypothetical protein
VACASLVAVNLVILLSGLLHELALPSPWALLASLGGLFLIDSTYLVVGVVAPTAKNANSFSSLPMTVQVSLLLAGSWKELPFWNGPAPAWLPLGGALVVDGPYSCLISLVASAGAGLLLLSVSGHLLQTRVGLVLRRGDE